MGTRGRADAVPRPALLGGGGAGTIARARQRARKRGRDRWVSAVDKLRFARPVAWGQAAALAGVASPWRSPR